MKLVATLSLALLVSSVSASGAEKGDGNVERGRYLAHHVALCVQCHSPRDAAGNLDATKLLDGGPVPVASPFRDLTFAAAAPRIAGLPGYTDREAIRLLMEGVARDGRAPRPPMPPFRLSQEDARDVVAYLRTLGQKR